MVVFVVVVFVCLFLFFCFGGGGGGVYCFFFSCLVSFLSVIQSFLKNTFMVFASSNMGINLHLIRPTSSP